MKQSSIIDELFSYIASFEPDFAGRTHGASPAEIERFQQMVGFPLPPLYCEFLNRLGAIGAECPVDPTAESRGHHPR